MDEWCASADKRNRRSVGSACQELDWPGLGLEATLDGLFDLVNLRVPARLQLGVDQLPVHRDLVASPIRGDKRQALDRGLELAQQCFRQTGGFGQVASLSAVLNLDAHRGLPP